MAGHWRQNLKPDADSPLLRARVGQQVVRKTPTSCQVRLIEKLTEFTIVLDTGERFWRKSGKRVNSSYELEPTVIEASPEEVAETVEARTLLQKIKAFCDRTDAVYVPLKDLRAAHRLTAGRRNDSK